MSLVEMLTDLKDFAKAGLVGLERAVGADPQDWPHLHCLIFD
jgi:hypothetical protein